MPQVYLCGPIAEGDEAARGGYQACNRRTIEALREFGVAVQPLPYPHPKTAGWRKFAEYVAGFLRLYRGVLGCRPGSIFHLTAMAGRFLYNEWPLVQFARLRGCHVVIDLRAGAGEDKYRRRGSPYRRLFRATLRGADRVMVEGESLSGFIEALVGERPAYLPNHVDTRRIAPRQEAGALPPAPEMVYVGRIVPEKGIEVALRAGRALQRSGLPVRMHFAGSVEPRYLQRLQREFADVGAQWHGALRSDAVLALLRKAHFFVFPTWHDGEGHSNALTEAMACGCVPVASRHGYNEAVIGDAGLTFPLPADAADYAAAIDALWRAGRWRALSRRASQRVDERFSSRTVVSGLLAEYERLQRRDAPA